MAVTASELRANIYRLLDEVVATGVPLDVDRKGVRLRIVSTAGGSKLSRLVPRPEVVVDEAEDLDDVDLGWEREWKEEWLVGRDG